MVGVAQLVELRIVVPAVVGSSPIAHPSYSGTGFRLNGVACYNAQAAEAAPAIENLGH